MCAGVGVHSGAHVRMVLSPAPVDTGIVFVRTDVRGVDNVIRAHADNVSETRNCTTLRNDAGVEIATVEHLMSACAGLGIDNLIVEVDGPEVPILDGSSAPFVQVLLNAGLKTRTPPQRVIRILEPIEVRMGAKSAALLPADDFRGPRPRRHHSLRRSPPSACNAARVQLTPKSFLADIADARTFGFLSDVETHARGRPWPRRLDGQCLVVDAGRVVNPEGLRFDDEFVRHKLLDAVGDLCACRRADLWPLCGGPARPRAQRPPGARAAGHARSLALGARARPSRRASPPGAGRRGRLNFRVRATAAGALRRRGILYQRHVPVLRRALVLSKKRPGYMSSRKIAALRALSPLRCSARWRRLAGLRQAGRAAEPRARSRAICR